MLPSQVMYVYYTLRTLFFRKSTEMLTVLRAGASVAAQDAVSDEEPQLLNWSSAVSSN